MPILGTVAAASARGFGFSSTDALGEQEFTSAGTYSFIVPAGVTAISAVAIGGGGGGAMTIRYNVNTNPASLITAVPIGNSCYAGGGGALAYVNAISVTPGETLTVVVGARGAAELLSSAGGTGLGSAGGDSYIRRASTDLVRAGGGKGSVSGLGGTVIVGSGGAGGAGGNVAWDNNYGTFIAAGGGGGAGGYSGAGGSGGSGSGSGNNGTTGSGGGSGGGGGGALAEVTVGISSPIFYAVYQGGAGGGGTQLLGQGSNGTGGTKGTGGSFTNPTLVTGPLGGGGGSGGATGENGGSVLGTNSGQGALYGGGGGSGGSRYTDQGGGVKYYNSAQGADASAGAVRIIWSTDPTFTRAFPSTNVGRL